jgi:ribonuclease HI
MLNARLLATVGGIPNDPKYIFSEDFVRECIKFFCRRLIKNMARCGFILWGAFAKKYENVIYDGVEKNNNFIRVFTWKHPSPQANSVESANNFKYCTNFREINEWFITNGLTPINFATHPMDYNYPEYIVFTDGSCVGPGTKDVRSGVGFIILKLISSSDQLSSMDVFPNIDVAQSLYVPIVEYSEHGTPSTIVGEKLLTSPRAELEAIYQGLKQLYDIGVKDGWLTFVDSKFGPIARHEKNILLVSDSEYAINYITEFNQINLNSDMSLGIFMLMRYLDPRIEYIHSHDKVETSPMPFWCYWNNRVDILARSGCDK